MLPRQTSTPSRMAVALDLAVFQKGYYAGGGGIGDIRNTNDTARSLYYDIAGRQLGLQPGCRGASRHHCLPITVPKPRHQLLPLHTEQQQFQVTNARQPMRCWICPLLTLCYHYRNEMTRMWRCQSRKKNNHRQMRLKSLADTEMTQMTYVPPPHG